MLLFDMTFQLTAGAVCAIGAREQLTDGSCDPKRTDAYRFGLIYSMMLYVPSGIAFFYAWPGWDSMYLFDFETNRIYGLAFAWLDAALLCGCCMWGFTATATWLRRGGGRVRPIALGLAALWLAVAVFLFVILWGRSFTVTSYSEFVAGDWPRWAVRWGEEDSFFGRPIMWCLLASAIIDIVPLFWIYSRIRRRSLDAG